MHQDFTPETLNHATNEIHVLDNSIFIPCADNWLLTSVRGSDHTAWMCFVALKHLCVCCTSTARVWDRRSRWSGSVRAVWGQRGQFQSAHEEEPPGLWAQRQPARLPQQRLLRGWLVRRGVREWKPLLSAVWRLQREVLGNQKQSQSPHCGKVCTPVCDSDKATGSWLDFYTSAMKWCLKLGGKSIETIIKIFLYLFLLY